MEIHKDMAHKNRFSVVGEHQDFFEETVSDRRDGKKMKRASSKEGVLTERRGARNSRSDSGIWLKKRLEKLSPEVADRLVRQADIEKTDLIIRLSFMVTLGTVIAAILLVIVLWPVQDHKVLLTWIAILLPVIGVRFWVFHRYYRRASTLEDKLRLEIPHAVVVVVSSAIWGVGAVFLMPHQSPLHQVVILAFLMGMAGGATGVYLPKQYLMLSVVSLFLVPQAIWFIFQGTFVTIVLGVGSLFLLVTVTRFNRALYDRLNQSFLLSQILEEEAGTDALTGLPNRRRLGETGAKMKQIAQESERELAVIIMDVDHFKRVNDKYGHDIGDRVLQKMASVIRENVPPRAFCWRIGGEEFGVMWVAEELEDACRTAEELRKAIAGSTIEINREGNHEKLKVTASFGIARGLEDIDELALAADQAMYEAKESGRNRVIQSGPEGRKTACA